MVPGSIINKLDGLLFLESINGDMEYSVDVTVLKPWLRVWKLVAPSYFN